MYSHKIYKLLVLFVISSLMSCHFNIQKISDNNSIPNLYGKWKMVAYEDYEKKEILVQDSSTTWYSLNDGEVTVWFDSLQMEAKIVSNGLWGFYTLDGRSIKFAEVFGNVQKEPQWATLFRDCIALSNRYEIDKSRLRIYCDSVSGSMLFERRNEK